MLTYLIEDSVLKVERIQQFWLQEFSAIKLVTFGSFNSGLAAICKTKPDLVLLDMTIPNFDRTPGGREGRLRPLGGYELMRKLKIKGMDVRVIVVSQLEAFEEEEGEVVTFSEMTSRCLREFPEVFLGSVYFSQGPSNSWQSELKVLVSAAFEVRP